MRITLVIPSLSTGGAERVISIVANHWAGAGREVTLVTFEDPSSDSYALDARVARASLGLAMPRGGPVSTLRYMGRVVGALRRELMASRPDVVISFMDITNVLAVLAMRGMRVPLVVTEHTDPREHRLNPVLRRARTLLYPRARALVVLTEAVRGWAQGRLHSSVHIIPNPILPPDAEGAASFRVPAPGRTVAGMGRLSYEKGFDQLIRAMAACAPRHPDWSLLILGEGPEREILTRQAAELGIADRVFLPGWVSNPTAVLRDAALFVVPSRYEGFNCALAEAMSCGLPAVSMDCPSGPGEIIRHGTDGILVPPGDVDALAAAMDRLMSDEVERERLGARGGEVLERFGVEPVMERWELLLRKMTAVGIEGRGAERIG